MTQEIIVYRNPGEKAFWDLLANGSFFPIMGGIVVFFVVFLVLNRVLTGGRSINVPAWKINTALAVAAVVGVVVAYHLWI